MLKRYRRALSPKADFLAIFRPQTGKFAELDGIRAIAILMVVMLHCLYGTYSLLEKPIFLEFVQSVPGWMNFAWQARGSDLIFILSGLLVSRTLVSELHRDGHIRLLDFYCKRLVRIMPLFVIALALHLLMAPVSAPYLWSNLLFVTNFFDNQHFIVPVGWSLNLQMQFYFVLPAVIWLLYKTGRPFLWGGVALLGAIAVCYFRALSEPTLVSMHFYEMLYKPELAAIYAKTLYYDLSTRFGPFLLGVLLAWALEWHRQDIRAAFLRRPLLPLVVLLASCALLYATASLPIHDETSEIYRHFSNEWNLFQLSTNKLLFALGATGLILLASIPTGVFSVVHRLLSLWFWRPVSQLIYGIYLFHLPFMLLSAFLVVGTFKKELITAFEFTQVLGIFGLTVLLTMLFVLPLHLFVEQPCIRMYRGRRGVAATAPAEPVSVPQVEQTGRGSLGV
ncbi:MAG TPA: acyltransferase [Dongiaceae bacterium]|nr:acyltransferase [Dongiaceae bacterium]